MKHALTDFLDALSRCRLCLRGVFAWSLRSSQRWFGPPPPRVQAGVHPSASTWEIVQLDPHHAGNAGEVMAPPGGDLQVPWQAMPLLLEHPPELGANMLDQGWTDRHLADWQRGLAATCQRLAPGERHLVLAWPDEGLWSTSITIPGPFSAEEFQTWLPEELDAVLPCGLAGAAWDSYPGLVMDPVGSLPGARWRAWWSRLFFRRRVSGAVGHSQGDVVVRCWAIPVQLAQALAVLSARLGLASLRVEPASVARARAAWQSESHSPDADRLSAVTAYGAACRGQEDGPDLLRRLHLPLGWRVRRWMQFHLPWLLAIAVTGSTGLAAGALQSQAWREATQQQEERWRQLQSRLDVRKQRQQQQLQARQLALEASRQQQALLNHNLQFVQGLQGLAVSLPPGVHWQAVNLRHNHIRLLALAGDSQALMNWMARWSDTLPAGVQPQLQWQPRTEGLIATRVDGATLASGHGIEVDVQLPLSPLTQGLE